MDGAGRPLEAGAAAVPEELAAAARRRIAEGTSGTVALADGQQWFVEAFAARPRLVIVGAVQVAIPLVTLASTLGYETVVVDGREAFLNRERFPHADRLELGWPDEVADRIGLGPADAVAVLSHDVKFDEPAIVTALRLGCRYVGAVGSRKTQADRRARLLAAGVTEAELARLHGPIGLDLGGRAPAETALAIMSQVVAARYGASGGPLRPHAEPGPEAATRAALRRAADLASAFREGLAERRVGVPEGVTQATLEAALGGPVPDAPTDPATVVGDLAVAADPGLIASAGPRYFGFVIGGGLPASLAADWLTSAWDQNGGLYASSPAGAVVEEVAGRWTVDLLGLPPETSVGFATGATMANFTAVAAGRAHALRRSVGWDVEALGLQGAPKLNVVIGADAHVTVVAALRLVGLGSAAPLRIPADDQGRIRTPTPCARRWPRRHRTDVLVCAQAGNVNSGAFDPLAEIVAHRARAGRRRGSTSTGPSGCGPPRARRRRHLIAGHDLADFVVDRRAQVAQRAVRLGAGLRARRRGPPRRDEHRASYLTPARGAARDPFDFVPELSRRARGFTVYAALRSLGRQGLAELVERCCVIASRMATTLAAAPGVTVLNDVVLDQVLVRFSDDDAVTQAVIAAVQAEGTIWLGGTNWRGQGGDADLGRQLVHPRGRRGPGHRRHPGLPRGGARPRLAVTTERPKVAAIVLAAGAGSRFGGGKLLAPLEGRPVLQHVLDTLAAAGLANVVVVLGEDTAAMETAVQWRTERRVRNPDPGRGLASSLQVGLAAAGEGTGAAPEAALIVLGDQPELRPETVAAILAAGDATHAILPKYEHDRGRNPVLLPARLWPVAHGLSGDQGLGAWLAAHPGEVREVPQAGANPDIDRPADLAELAWARRVRANREQVDRFREVPDGADFYASTSSIFRADPDRTDDDVANVLLGLARPNDVWLDIGAGAGRYALPLARHVRKVVAIEPSPGMAGALAEVAADHGIANVRQVAARWPMEQAPAGDVALMAHVGYDIERIGPFLDAMEAAAPCRVALLMEQQPAMAAAPFWAAIYGEPRIPLPALPEFLDVLEARGAAPTVARLPATPARYGSFDEMLGFLRRQTWVAPGGASDRKLVETARATAVETPEGWRLLAEPPVVGIVTWGSWDR